jgi:hypothetical protein
LSNFWEDFANWEKTIILACMRDKRLISTSKPSSTLNDLPPAVLCHVFTNLDVFLNAEILKVIRSTIPASSSTLLPVDPYPLVFYYSPLTITRTRGLGLGHISGWLPNLRKISSLATTSRSSRVSQRFSPVNLPLYLSRSPKIPLFSGLALVLCCAVYPPNITQLPTDASWSSTELYLVTSTTMDSVSAYPSFFPPFFSFFCKTQTLLMS